MFFPKAFSSMYMQISDKMLEFWSLRFFSFYTFIILYKNWLKYQNTKHKLNIHALRKPGNTESKTHTAMDLGGST